jgi:dihydrofolate reductase
MSRLTLDITMSLDGFIAGPNQTVERPLGDGGERIHEWMYRLAAFRDRHGGSGGERNADDDVLRESVAATGAVLMGRRMFSGGEGGWEDDPVADGWWGDDPPFGVPVFVLTHHPRGSVTKQGGTSYTFVTEGLEAAAAQARAAAGDKDVAVAGGADVVQQCLRAGLLEEMQIHLAPLLLGGGVRLFDDLGADPAAGLELARVIDSPTVTHLRYRIKSGSGSS